MKRFYKTVSISESENGFGILLDNRPLKTAKKQKLITPFKRVAEQIMTEWSDQKEIIIPHTMPMTQILNTRIDRVEAQRPTMTGAILKYVHTDLLYYQVDEPPEVKAAQGLYWNPWIKWAEKKFNCTIKTTIGLAALEQSRDLEIRIAETIMEMSHDHFTIFQICTPLCGSVIMGLAFTTGAADINDMMQAAFAEENVKEEIYNAKKYGADPLIEKQKKEMYQDLQACKIYRDCL